MYKIQNIYSVDSRKPIGSGIVRSKTTKKTRGVEDKDKLSVSVSFKEPTQTKRATAFLCTLPIAVFVSLRAVNEKGCELANSFQSAIQFSLLFNHRSAVARKASATHCLLQVNVVTVRPWSSEKLSREQTPLSSARLHIL